MTPELAAVVVAAGVVVGVLSALLGVGGGLLMVPFMVLALGETQHLSEGTSLLVIVPTAVAGSVAHYRRGFLRLRPAVLLAAGGIAGVYFGASVALRIDASSLQVLFGAFLGVMGVRNVVRGAGALRGARAARP